MSFFKNLKDIYKKVAEVETSIYNGKQDYLEIYERNLQLEQEIQERTRELNIANKRMLTLQHIWDMMNASRPLQSVLETMHKRVSEKRYKRIKEILEDLEEQAKICGVKDTRLDEMLKIINK